MKADKPVKMKKLPPKKCYTLINPDGESIGFYLSKEEALSEARYCFENGYDTQLYLGSYELTSTKLLSTKPVKKRK